VLRRRALVTGCAVAVVVAGCSSGSGKAEPTTTVKAPASTTPPTTRAPVTTSTSTTTPVPGPLLVTLILEDVPSGYPQQPDVLAATGPTDLEKAVLEDPLNDENEARQLLVTAGFLRGYQRQWSTENVVGQNFIYLYQFATPAGATSYLSHWRAAAIADVASAAPVPFTPAVPGSTGLLSRSERASSGVVLFAKGPYAVQAVVTGGPGVDESSRTTELAFAQYARLP